MNLRARTLYLTFDFTYLLVYLRCPEFTNSVIPCKTMRWGDAAAHLWLRHPCIKKFMPFYKPVSSSALEPFPQFLGLWKILYAELPLHAGTVTGFVGCSDTAADLHRQPRAWLQTLPNRKRWWHLACMVHSVLGAHWQALPLPSLLFQINPRNVLSHVWP